MRTIEPPVKHTVNHWYSYILAYAEDAALKNDYRANVSVKIKPNIYKKVEKKLIKDGFKVAKCIDSNDFVDMVILSWD